MADNPVTDAFRPAANGTAAEPWRLAHEIPLSWGRMAYVLDLFCHLVSMELRLLYKRSWVGVAWALLNPIIQLVVFSLVFARVLNVKVAFYPLFLCCGLLCWNAFTDTLTLAVGSIVKTRNALYQPGFPPFMLPIVLVTVGLIHFMFSFSIVAALLVYYQVPPGWPLTALPLLIAIQALLTLALAFPLAALHVRFDDLKHLLTVVFRFMFFLTPILYATDTFPRVYRLFYAVNPLTHLIEGYRAILMHGAWPSWMALAGVALASVILLILGFRFFESRRFQFIEEL